MKHLDADQMALHYYCEPVQGAAEHLADCEECQVEFRRIEAALDAVSEMDAPERGAEYGADVWARLRLDDRPVAGRKWAGWRMWAWAPALAAMVIAAFLAGRYWPRPDAGGAAARAGAVRERVLLVAVGDHLDRSQVVLAELTHAPADGGSVDISSERRTAEDLLDDNRLYRQTARTAGDGALASVLDDLETVLVEIANGPSDISARHLEELQRRIASEGLLFKVRVVGSQVRRRERPAAGNL